MASHFPFLLRETVFDKLAMTDSSYEQPLPQTRIPLTATGTYQDGSEVAGKWHIYPEMAAAGLWTTPTDLAQFAIEIALSKIGKSNRILSQKMTNEMLTPCSGRCRPWLLPRQAESWAVWAQRSGRRLPGTPHYERPDRQGPCHHG